MEEPSTVATNPLDHRFISKWALMQADEELAGTSTPVRTRRAEPTIFEHLRRVLVSIVPRCCRRRAPFFSTSSRSPAGQRAVGDDRSYRVSPGGGHASTPSAWTTNDAVVPRPTLVGRGSDSQDDPQELSLNTPERRNSAEAQDVQLELLMHDHPFRSAFVAYLTCFEGGPRSSSGDGGAGGARTTARGHRFEWQGHWQAEPLWFTDDGPTKWSLLNGAARVCVGFVMRFLNFGGVIDIGRSDEGEGDDPRPEVPESLAFNCCFFASIFGRVDVKYFFRDTVYQQSNLPVPTIEIGSTTTRATPSQTQGEVAPARSDVKQHYCLCTNVDGENFFDEILVDSDVDSSSSVGGPLVFLRCKLGRGSWKRRDSI